MMQTSLLRSVRIYSTASQRLEKILTAVRALWVGVWLGILDQKALHAIDQLCYEQWREYQSDDYNLQGLNAWEQEMIARYFAGCQRLMLIGAGGGREVVALHKAGYKIDGFECHPELVSYANRVLQQEQLDTAVMQVARDDCPVAPNSHEAKYDGLIVGWGTYMLIQGRQRRVQFLIKMRDNGIDGAPILLSFFVRDAKQQRFRLIKWMANLLRRPLKRPLLELGDGLAPNFVHYFSRDEITSELAEAGFVLSYFSDEEYGHAVAHAC